MRALILSADHFEDSELRVPCDRLREAGFEVDIASAKRGKITGKHGFEIEVSRTLQQVDPDSYEILLIPGGNAPAALRKERAALEIVRAFFEKNRPVAAICHGPQVLISAGVMSNRRATCYRTVAQELIDAGASYEDREVVVDRNLITSRKPSDLGPFMREVLAALRKSAESERSEL